MHDFCECLVCVSLIANGGINYYKQTFLEYMLIVESVAYCKTDWDLRRRLEKSV
jgi:hypothetical protein